MTKQFKIGEYAIGGIIKISTKNSQVKIEAIDYEDKHTLITGYYDINNRNSINEFLNELTSCYYADKITDYIYNN